jgi:predicted transposase YdaD
MTTDKQIHQIFEVQPGWVFELAGKSPAPSSEYRSITFKSLERRADGVLIPADPSWAQAVVEIQFWRDEWIYMRVVEEMAALQGLDPARPVEGMIFFAEPAYDPQTAPWASVVQHYLLHDAVRQLEARHPLVAVLQPLLEPDESRLEREAAGQLRQIRQSGLTERSVRVLMEVFVNWLEQRFQDRGKQEIEAMLLTELPALEKTQSGKDLIRIGEKRGKKLGQRRGLQDAVLTVLASKRLQVSVAQRRLIQRLDAAGCRTLLDQLLKWRTLEPLDSWLAERARRSGGED